jgi:hypothetical protein
MEAVRTCETSVNIYLSALQYIPEDSKLHTRYHENLKSHTIFKYSVRTAKRTPHFTITNINWLMLFKEIIPIYSEKNTKPINKKNAKLMIVK